MAVALFAADLQTLRFWHLSMCPGRQGTVVQPSDQWQHLQWPGDQSKGAECARPQDLTLGAPGGVLTLSVLDVHQTVEIERGLSLWMCCIKIRTYFA